MGKKTLLTNRLILLLGKMEDVDVKDVFENLVKSKYHFDYNLKEQQIEIIGKVLKQKNVMGCLCTGFGKSSCFLIPPLIWDEVNSITRLRVD